MNTKNNKRSKLTRKLLREAYLELLHDNSNSRITVKDICQIADVNRSTFYLYYDEPNDILKEIEDTTIAEVLEHLRQIQSKRKDPLNAKGSLLELLVFIQKNQLLFSTLLIDNSNPSFRLRFNSLTLEMVEQSFPVILQSEEYSSAYRFISNGSLALITDWISNDCSSSKKQLCDTLFTLSKGCLDSISIDMTAH